MLRITHLARHFGVHTVLSDINLIINPGDRIGLIGANGCGKSTLLRLIAGLDVPDGGQIALRPGTSIGYLPQTFLEQQGRMVGEILAAALADYTSAAAELQSAADALAAAEDYGAAMERYAAALERFEALGGYEREQRAAAVLDQLGLGAVPPETPVDELSGGQKTRLGLATLLVSEPDLLLLDEPTNHLDVEALEWLEGFVRAYPGAALIVSHDRTFLDQTVSQIVVMEQGLARSYTGTYSDYVAAREHERDLHAAAWHRQQEYIAEVQSDIYSLKGRALATENTSTPTNDHDMKHFLGRRSAVAKKMAKIARSRERKLERYLAEEDRVEKPRASWQLHLDFGTPPAGGRAVLRTEGLRFAYPGGPELIGGLSLDVQHGERVALIGPNGAGKTTLLRLLSGALHPTEGRVSLGGGIRLGVLTQEQEQLDLRRTVLATALAERPMSESEARTFLHLFLFAGDSVFRLVGQCSPGERSRLQLALLVLRGCNLLLLDEPLNHLDIAGREHFEEALQAFEGTLLVVAHDRTFLRNIAERIVEVRGGAATVFAGGYDDLLWMRGRAQPDSSM